ncbi:helix-turn-helix transcriptional regulator, partial [Staphylococcus aureus]|nr:helix-turn-helix transcriptional regulator [Staphylococcus aureus]
DSRKIELSADDIWPPEASALMLQGDRRLAALRKWRKLDQAELARAAGIAPEVLSELERGDRRAGAETTEALALAL